MVFQLFFLIFVCFFCFNCEKPFIFFLINSKKCFLLKIFYNIFILFFNLFFWFSVIEKVLSFAFLSQILIFFIYFFPKFFFSSLFSPNPFFLNFLSSIFFYWKSFFLQFYFPKSFSHNFLLHLPFIFCKSSAEVFLGKKLQFFFEKFLLFYHKNWFRVTFFQFSFLFFLNCFFFCHFQEFNCFHLGKIRKD